MKKFEISPSKAARLIEWIFSVVFMMVAWLVFAGFLILALIAIAKHTFIWGIISCALVCLDLLVVLLIPFQVARYFHQKRDWDSK